MTNPSYVPEGWHTVTPRIVVDEPENLVRFITDATYMRALDAGATSIEDPSEMPYGDRRAMVSDSWGNSWQIATHRGQFTP